MNKKKLAIFVLVLFSLVAAYAQTTTLSVDTQIAAGNVTQGTIKHPVYHFHLARNATGTVNLTGLSFTTAGTYTSADVTKFQLWYNTTDALSSATQISSDLTSGLGTGSHSFASFSQLLAASATRYFWITTDFAINATTSRTLNVSAFTTSNFTVSSGTTSGSASASGSQTITAFATLSTDYFRSLGTGNWATAGTWESSHDNSNWATATSSPTDAANTITIRNGHTVTVAANVSTDQTVINSGGQVNISSGITLTIADGSGTDLSVSGTIRNNAGTITTTGTLSFESGGLYQHNYTTTAGTVPTATWDSNSTIEFVGYTSYSGNLSLGQTFGNFTWNCPNQTANVSANETLDTITGNLTISATNTGQFQLGNGANTTTVSGDLTLSGGTFNLSAGNALVINLSGDLTISGGTLTESGTGSGTINFAGTSAQLLTISGSPTISNTINFNVNSGATLEFASASTVLSGSAGTFTAASGSTMIIKHAGGIASTGATGCVQTTGTRTFNAGANYTYTGSVAQVTGSGLTGANNLQISNTGGVTLSAGTTIAGNCVIDASCSLSTNNNAIAFGGNFTNAGTFTAGSSAVTIQGTATQSIDAFTTTGTVSMTKTGGTATLNGNVSGGALTINGTGGTLNLGSGLTHTFSGTWTRTAGTLNGGSSTLRLGSGFSGTGGTFTAGTGTVEYNATGIQTIAAVTYNNLTLSGTSAKTITGATVNGIFTIAGTATTTGTILTYGGSSTLRYDGSGVQTVGIEWPSTFARPIIIANTNGVVLDASKATYTGTLTVNGKLTTGTYQLTGSVINNGTVASARTDIMSSGTLTNNTGSTIDYTTPLNIPASSGYYNLTLSAAGHYQLTGNVTGINTLNLTTPTTYLHLGAYTISYVTLTGSGSLITDPVIALTSPNPAVAAGNILQGSLSSVFYTFSTAVTANSATLNSVTFVTAGTAVVTTDLTNFKLWYNSANLFSGASQIGTTMTTGLSAGSHTFSGLTQTIANGATGYFWITADIASGATLGRTLQVTPAITTANLSFEYGTKSGTAYAGGIQTIASPTVTLASTNPAVAAANIASNTAKVPIYRFTLARDAIGGTVNLTGLSFTNTGTYVAADVTKFQLWTNTVDLLSSAVQISTDITTGLGTGTHAFASFTQDLTISATRFFWITTDVAPGAVNGGTMTVSALTTAQLTTSYGQKAGTASAGGAQTIVSPLTTLASSNPAVAAANIGDGSLKNMIYRFTLARNANGTASLNSVTFTTTGTLTTAELPRLQLWSYSADSLNAAGATAIGEITTSTGAGSHTFSGLSQLLTASATRYFWITADVASGATAGRTIAVSAITTANITVSQGSLTGSTNAGNNQTVIARVVCTTTDYAVPALNVAISQTKVPIYKFSMARSATTGTINLTALSFITGGSYTNTDINKYQLWTNTSDNLSTATQISSNITATLEVGSHSFASFTQAIAVSSTRYFWITTDFTGTAVVDNVIGVAALTTSNLTLSAGTLSLTAFSGGAQRIITSQVTLRSANPALPVANVGQQTAKYPIYRFTVSTNEPVGAINLTSVTFTSAGTYQSTDVSKFQLWTSLTDQLDDAVQLGTDITTSLGAGSRTFSGLTQSLTAGSTRFFWITTDIALTAVINRTINVSAMTTSDIAVSSGTKGGVAYASGAQTITSKGWTYTKRQPIAQLSGAGTGFQIKYIINYGNGTDSGQTVYLNGNCRTDFGDVRFYTGTTELKYWMESMTPSSTATFWVKLAGDLGAGNINVDINYGNPNALTTSNGINTFLFFDDFGSDLSKWIKYKYIEGSSASIPSGQSYVRMVGGLPTGTYGHSVLGTYPGYNSFQDGVVEYRYRVASEAISEVSIRSRMEYSTGTVVAGKGYKARSDQRSSEGQSIHKPPFYGWQFVIQADLSIPVIDQWYRGSFAAAGTSLKFYRDGNLMRSVSDSSYPNAGDVTIQNHYGTYTDYDWIAIRKNTAAEPSYGSWMYPSYYYRTIASGDWTNTATWEASPDNATWTPATMAPDQLSLGILIRNAHVVTANGNFTVDQMTIAAGGKLIIESTNTFTVVDGAGTDLTVSGILATLGTGIVAGNGSVLFNADSKIETQNVNGVYYTASSGCIQNTGGLTLNNAVSYTFNGTTAQTPGNWTSGTDTGLDIVIDNPAGVTLSEDIIVNGWLNVKSGALLVKGAYSITGVATNSGTIKSSVATIASGTVTHNAGSTINFTAAVIIPTGSATAYRNLVLGGTSAAYTMSGNVTVHEVLTLGSNNLTIGAYTLTINGYIDNSGGGYVDWGTSGDVTVGGSDPLYLPSPIDLLSLANNVNLPNDVTVNTLDLFGNDLSFVNNYVYLEGKYFGIGGVTNSINELSVTHSPTSVTYGSGVSLATQWRITGNQSGAVNLKLIFPASLSASPSLRVWRRDTTSGDWTRVGIYTPTGTDPRVITVTGVTNINGMITKGSSDWTIAENDQTLPVELSSFTAFVSPQNFVRLDWITQSETGVMGYYIYRNTSDDLSTASLISPLITATNTAQVASYSYTDSEIPGNNLYYYWLQNLDLDGVREFHGPVTVNLVENNNEAPEIPLVTSLNLPYPNPFNPSTTISYGLAKAEQVVIDIYNVRGEKVRNLVFAQKSPGNYRITWDGKNSQGQALASGIYFVKMQAGKYGYTQKLIMMK